MNSVYRVEFQDQGQGLTWFDIGPEGVVIGAGPARVYAAFFGGAFVIDIQVPGHLIYRLDGRRYQIKYPVIAIKTRASIQ